jgi:hypothetical protein
VCALCLDGLESGLKVCRLIPCRIRTVLQGRVDRHSVYQTVIVGHFIHHYRPLWEDPHDQAEDRQKELNLEATDDWNSTLPVVVGSSRRTLGDDIFR